MAGRGKNLPKRESGSASDFVDMLFVRGAEPLVDEISRERLAISLGRVMA